MQAELRERIVARLRGTAPSANAGQWRLAGLPPQESERRRAHFPANPVPAAVLVPLVDHPDGLTVLLTQRAEGLRKHGGQISFPGGRIERGDDGPLAAALRETREEIGLDPRHVELVGRLDEYRTGTGFRITPVVGILRPPFALSPDAGEVDAIFEVPLSFLLDPANHAQRSRMIGERSVDYYEMAYGDHVIWGATAAMLVRFYRRLVAVGSATERA